jgi:hypothetical protein
VGWCIATWEKTDTRQGRLAEYFGLEFLQNAKHHKWDHLQGGVAERSGVKGIKAPTVLPNDFLSFLATQPRSGIPIARFLRPRELMGGEERDDGNDGYLFHVHLLTSSRIIGGNWQHARDFD